MKIYNKYILTKNDKILDTETNKCIKKGSKEYRDLLRIFLGLV